MNVSNCSSRPAILNQSRHVSYSARGNPKMMYRDPNRLVEVEENERTCGGLPTHLKSKAGECETQTQGEQRRNENGEEYVTASSGEPEAVAAEPPGAFGTPDAFRFADHIVPHHLRTMRSRSRENRYRSSH